MALYMVAHVLGHAVGVADIIAVEELSEGGAPNQFIILKYSILKCYS